DDVRAVQQSLLEPDQDLVVELGAEHAATAHATELHRPYPVGLVAVLPGAAQPGQPREPQLDPALVTALGMVAALAGPGVGHDADRETGHAYPTGRCGGA